MCAAIRRRPNGDAPPGHVEIRLDTTIIDFNPNPDVSPTAGFDEALKARGIGFPRFVSTAVGNAARRLDSCMPGHIPRAPAVA